jgi:hypothetical protein
VSAAKQQRKVVIENRGSLLTYKDRSGRDCCLNYLFYAPGMGVYDPSIGKVEVTKEEADTHNRLLSEALIAGLETCEIGQCGTFYRRASNTPSRIEVTTWTGEVVGTAIRETGASRFRLTRRSGRVFEVTTHKDSDMVTLTRIK